ETSKSQGIVGLYPAGGGMETLKKDQQLGAITKVKWARFTLDADEKEATIKGVAEGTDEKAMASLQEAFDSMIALMKGGGELMSLFGNAENKKTGKALVAFAKASKTSVKGKEVHVSATADPATVATTLTYVWQQAMKKKQE